MLDIEKFEFIRFYNVSLSGSIYCSAGGNRVYFIILNTMLRELGVLFVEIGEGSGPWR